MLVALMTEGTYAEQSIRIEEVFPTLVGINRPAHKRGSWDRFPADHCMHFPTSDVSEYYRWRNHRVPGMGERKVIALLLGYDGRSFQAPAFQ